MSAIIGFGLETKYFVQLIITAFFFHSCKVYLDVTIRIVHARSSPEIRDFPCFMKIRGNHNHPLDTADVLNQLRVSPCTREIFESYFRQGIYMKCYIHMHKPFNLKDFFRFLFATTVTISTVICTVGIVFFPEKVLPVIF